MTELSVSYLRLDEAALAALVESFYRRVRADDVLGPVFARAIADEEWPAHLERMTAFWSSVTLTSGRYHGDPMRAHLKHRDAIAPDMFLRWLAFWEEAARERLAPEDAESIIAKARRIAESLKLALSLPPSVFQQKSA